MAGFLGLPLGVDLSRFDQDLQKVADRIESLGKASAVKIGTAAGDISTGKLSGDELAARLTMLGEKLASSMANGTRKASVYVTGLSGHIDKMLDKLVGSAVTIFRGIDSVIKLPVFDAFLKRTELKLGNFINPAKQSITKLDVMLKGGFGAIAARVSSVFEAILTGLATRAKPIISEMIINLVQSIEGIANRLATHIGEALSNGFRSSFSVVEADASALFGKIDAMASTTFSKFPDMGKGGLKSSVPGPKIGQGTDFSAPLEIPAPKIKFAPNNKDQLEAIDKFKKQLADKIKSGPKMALKLAAVSVYVPLKGINTYRRFRALLASLGDVGKSSYHKLFEGHGIVYGAVIKLTRGITGTIKAVFRFGTLRFFRRKTADVEQFGNAVNQSKGHVSRLGSALRSVGGQVAAAFGIIGVIYKTVQFLRDGIKSASDLNETVSRSKVVFGESFGVVNAQAESMSRRFRVARGEQLDIASGFGAMAQGAGLSEKASAGLANRMTKLAADFNSSVNIGFANAGEKIRSVLAGNSEPLRQFGADVSAAKVEAYALGHGMVDASGKVSEAGKIMARAALIEEGLAYTQGDLERTAGSAANQFRKAGGGLAEFGTRIGTILLPVVQAGTEAFNDLLGTILDLAEGAAPVLQNWMQKVANVMKVVGMVVRNSGSFWEIAKLKIGEFAENTMRQIETIPENFSRITAWVGKNWAHMVYDLGQLTMKFSKNLARNVVGIGKIIWNSLGSFGKAISGFFSGLIKNAVNFGKALWSAITTGEAEFTWTPMLDGFRDLTEKMGEEIDKFNWTPLLDGFKATTEAMPELIKPNLISVQSKVDEIMSQIAKRELERANLIAGAGGNGKKPPGEVPETTAGAQKPEYRLGGALEVGSREAFSAISRNLAGRKSSTDVAKQGVAVQKTIAQNTREMADQLKARKAPMELQVF